jgi:hypothetical protein
MSVIITFMFDPAKLQMNWARASGTSIALKGAVDVVGSVASDIGINDLLWCDLCLPQAWLTTT